MLKVKLICCYKYSNSDKAHAKSDRNDIIGIYP